MEIVGPGWYTFDQAFDRTLVRQIDTVHPSRPPSSRSTEMSVATEFAPVVRIPPQARGPRPPERLATVTTLYRPSPRSVAPPMRLTRRGVLVLAAAVAVLASALVTLAWLSAPSIAGGAPARPVADVVTVPPGGSLWSVATQLAPNRDPRAEIEQLKRLNHLDDEPLVPGQVLRTH
jgi:hypothetical protein